PTLFSSRLPPAAPSTPFPSTTLFRSALHGSLDITTQTVNAPAAWQLGWNGTGFGVAVIDSGIALKHDLTRTDGVISRVVLERDRSEEHTLNSSHGSSSYAVFCLKKKT